MRNNEKQQEQKEDRGPGEMSSFNNREDNRTGTVEDVKEKENAVAKKENEDIVLQQSIRDEDDKMEE